VQPADCTSDTVLIWGWQEKTGAGGCIHGSPSNLPERTNRTKQTKQIPAPFYNENLSPKCW